MSKITECGGVHFYQVESKIECIENKILQSNSEWKHKTIDRGDIRVLSYIYKI